MAEHQHVDDKVQEAVHHGEGPSDYFFKKINIFEWEIGCFRGLSLTQQVLWHHWLLRALVDVHGADDDHGDGL